MMARRLACENSRFRVYLDELHRDGKLHVRDYLTVVPKRQFGDLITGTAVLPVFEGKIGLLHIYRHPIGRSCWEIPRGFLEDAEGGVASALRELEEETGLTCSPEAVHSLGIIAPDAGVLGGRLQLFVATACVRARPYEPTELGHREFRFFEPAEIDGMVLQAEIQDACTLIAYSHFLRGLYAST